MNTREREEDESITTQHTYLPLVSHDLLPLHPLTSKALEGDTPTVTYVEGKREGKELVIWYLKMVSPPLL